MTDWEPATEAEAALRDALRTGDQELYFRILSRVDLLLPVSPDALAGRAPAGWGTWTTGGRTHILAFTSPEAMRACLADHGGSARRVPYAELANSWPDQEWWLAINPGLPIEGYLPAWFVSQLIRGEVRLPGRTIGARARVEAATAARARGAAAVPVPPPPPPAPLGGRRVLPMPPVPPQPGAHQAIDTGRARPEPAPPRPERLRPRAPAHAAPEPEPEREPRKLTVIPPRALPPRTQPAPEPTPTHPLEGYTADTRVSGEEPAAGEPSWMSSRLAEAARLAPPRPATVPTRGEEPDWSSARPSENRREPIEPRTDPTELWREPIETRREPTEPWREPAETRRPGETRQPTEPWREPTEPRRESVEAWREAIETRHEPTETRHEPTEPRREPTESWRGATATWRAPAETARETPEPVIEIVEPQIEERTVPVRRSEPIDAEVVTPEPELEPEPEPEFEPANEVESDLLAAANDGQTDQFLSTLLLAKVLVPIPAGASTLIKPGETGFMWRREQVEGQPYVVVFTSSERLTEYLGDGVETLSVKFSQLITKWPDESWSFAVNPGTPVGATLPGVQIRALATWAQEVGLTDQPSVEYEEASVAVGTAVVPANRPVVMQKPIAPTQVSYYLERGYDRVSGFVQRATEVAHLTTPDQLYQALGLGYAGSPFKTTDEEVYVLRWTAHRPNLYRIPFGGRDEAGMRAMQGWVIERAPFRGNGFAPGESGEVIAEFKVDSARLPHGAQMWRMTRDSGETLIALLDADGPKWRMVDDILSDEDTVS